MGSISKKQRKFSYTSRETTETNAPKHIYTKRKKKKLTSTPIQNQKHPSQTHSSKQTLTKMLSLVHANADTCRQEVCTQKATQRENKNTQRTNSRQLLHFVYFSPSPWGAPAPSFFLGGGTFLTLPLSMLCLLLPILSFLWGRGCFLRGAPGVSVRWG